MDTEPEPQVVAAIDLGSNSFHMMIARAVQGRIHVIDRLREQVQLAAGLDREGRISTDAQGRALECLERFAQRVRDLPSTHVRAVGTNTLRQARDSTEFLAQAQQALGYRIEVLPGREEARLIYLGAAHDLPDDASRRLVVDIGGGSTEFIIGERFGPLVTDSLYMGCVSFSRRYFGDGRISRERMRDAIIAARLELQSIERRYRSLGWQEAIGTSGTVTAVDAIVRSNGWSHDGITPRSLKKLRKSLVEAGNVEALSLPGLAPDRAPIIGGGAAILSAVFESLEVERMKAAKGALREGLAYDLFGRIRHEDVRERTIEAFMERYWVDREQAARVERTALDLFAQTARAWNLDQDQGPLVLSWGARLHEIGLAVSYSGHHKHGAYLLANSDMPGFSKEDRRLLAAIVQGHRRRLRRSTFASPAPAVGQPAQRLCVLLRLAVLLNRARSDRPLPALRVEPGDAVLLLCFPDGWLDAHPLTRADLANEAHDLHKGLGLELQFE